AAVSSTVAAVVDGTACGANPFDYLTELQQHVEELAENPSQRNNCNRYRLDNRSTPSSSAWSGPMKPSMNAPMRGHDRTDRLGPSRLASFSGGRNCVSMRCDRCVLLIELPAMGIA